MGQLGYYANRATTTKGLEHNMNVIALRRYIRTTPERELLEEIDMFSKPEHLRALWEAGLNSTLQAAVLRRTEEIIERRG